MAERGPRGTKPDGPASTPRPIAVWFVFTDLLLAAALVFIGLNVGGVGLAMAWLSAAGFTVIAFLHGWMAFRRR